MFTQNQKRVCQKMDGIKISIIKNQMLKRVINFGVIYGIMRKNMKTNDINKTTDMIKKIQNSKSAGLDGVQGYCLTKLTALDERLAK